MSSRYALLCGLREYAGAHFSYLHNSFRGADALRKTLERDYHFNVELLGPSCDGILLKTRLEDFLTRSRHADVVLLFFAGHGVRVDISTFFVPTGATLGSFVSNFLDQCVQTERLISDTIGVCRNARRIFLFDSCRTSLEELKDQFNDWNEYVPPKAIRKPGERDVVVRAARLDEKAYDGRGPNTPFINALLAELEHPEFDFSDQVDRAKARYRRDSDVAGDFEMFVGEDMYGFHLREKNSVFKLAPVVRPPLDQGRNITRVALSKSGSLAAVTAGNATTDGSIRVLSTHSGRKLVAQEVLETKAYCVDFDRSDEHVVFGQADGRIGVLSLKDRTIRWFLDRCEGPVNCIEWSPQSDYVVTTSTDRTVRVFEAALSGREIVRGLHRSATWTVSWHRNGEDFISGAHDGTCLLWNVYKYAPGPNKTLEPRRALGFGSAVRVVRFSPDGTVVAVGTQSAEIFVYRFFEETGALVLLRKLRHQRRARRVNLDEILKSLEYNSADKAALDRLGYGRRLLSQEEKESFVDSRLYILALDISSDNNVLAYGTNIDGYYLIDLETEVEAERFIGSLDEHVTGKSYFRVPAIRLHTRSGKMVAACGRKVVFADFRH